MLVVGRRERGIGEGRAAKEGVVAGLVPGLVPDNVEGRPRKTRFCSDERGWVGLRRGVGFDFGGEDGQH
jgi:hypothetical protein